MVYNFVLTIITKELKNINKLLNVFLYHFTVAHVTRYYIIDGSDIISENIESHDVKK